jgi:hypothetical protein
MRRWFIESRRSALGAISYGGTLARSPRGAYTRGNTPDLTCIKNFVLPSLTDTNIDRMSSIYLIDALFRDRKSDPPELIRTNPRISRWLVKHRHRDFTSTQRQKARTLSPRTFYYVAIVYKSIGYVYNLLL